MSDFCPSCKRGGIRRTARHGFAEKFMYSLLGYFPWWCSKCTKRVMLRDRGEMSSRRPNRQAAHSSH